MYFFCKSTFYVPIVRMIVHFIDWSCIALTGIFRYSNTYVTSFINRAVIRRFSADSCFKASPDHRQIFSTLNHVVKGQAETSAGHRRVTLRRSPDFFRRWHNFRPMSRRRSAGARAVTAGPPAGGRWTARNRTITVRSSAGHRQMAVRASCGHRRICYGWNLEMGF